MSYQNLADIIGGVANIHDEINFENIDILEDELRRSNYNIGGGQSGG